MKQLLILFVGLCAAGSLMAQKTQIIAHRGYWLTEGSAQNSIRSLVKADSVNCYGSEFDVYLTIDKKLVCNHDKVFKAVDINKATEKVCRAIELDNGENMPTLDEYLEAAKKLNTKLILEQKTLSSHALETEMVQLIVDCVKKHGLEDRVEYITFSRFAAMEFVRLAPKGTPVYPLNGDVAPHMAKTLGFAGIDYNAGVFYQHPEWIEECHKLGLKVNVWTVDDPQEMQLFIDYGVDYITTNQPVILKEKLSRK